MKRVEVSSPPSHHVQEFTEALRRYFPVRWIPTSGGGVSVSLCVYAGREPRRFTIISGMPMEDANTNHLTQTFWNNYKDIRRQKMWFAWR
jgi:hypothetical protein